MFWLVDVLAGSLLWLTHSREGCGADRSGSPTSPHLACWGGVARADWKTGLLLLCGLLRGLLCGFLRCLLCGLLCRLLRSFLRSHWYSPFCLFFSAGHRLRINRCGFS